MFACQFHEAVAIGAAHCEEIGRGDQHRARPRMLCLRESGVELCRIAHIDCNQFEPKGFGCARHLRQDRRRPCLAHSFCALRAAATDLNDLQYFRAGCVPKP
jgi:hypothetical protein